jgi:hypothetical protein
MSEEKQVKPEEAMTEEQASTLAALSGELKS